MSYSLGEAGIIDKTFEVDAHFGIVHGLAHSATLNLVCTVGHDGFARVWDMRTPSDEVTHITNLGQIGSSVSWSPLEIHQIVGISSVILLHPLVI
mgnify:CR=1 FL=1